MVFFLTITQELALEQAYADNQLSKAKTILLQVAAYEARIGNIAEAKKLKQEADNIVIPVLRQKKEELLTVPFIMPEKYKCSAQKK